MAWEGATSDQAGIWVGNEPAVWVKALPISTSTSTSRYLSTAEAQVSKHCRCSLSVKARGLNEVLTASYISYLKHHLQTNTDLHPLPPSLKRAPCLPASSHSLAVTHTALLGPTRESPHSTSFTEEKKDIMYRNKQLYSKKTCTLNSSLMGHFLLRGERLISESKKTQEEGNRTTVTWPALLSVVVWLSFKAVWSKCACAAAPVSWYVHKEFVFIIVNGYTG